MMVLLCDYRTKLLCGKLISQFGATPRNHLCDQRLFGYTYVPWCLRGEKSAIRLAKCLALDHPAGLIVYFPAKNFSLQVRFHIALWTYTCKSKTLLSMRVAEGKLFSDGEEPFGFEDVRL